MEGFRERLNRNDDRRDRPRERGRDYEAERDRDRRGDRDRDGGRDGGYTPRGATGRRYAEPETPGGSSVSNQRLRNQGWDSTPASTARGGPSSTPRSWDSTPRSVRGDPSSSRRDGREWDTPRSVRVGGDESPGPIEPPSSYLDQVTWEEEQLQSDREWYNLDDQAGGGNEFDGYDDFSEREAQLVKKAGGGAGPKKRITARQAHFNAETEAWENNQLAVSGVTGERRVLDFDSLDDEEESRVHLLVHDLKPPFLDGRLAFTKQLEPINPIKDPTSDLAVFSKKGSLLVQERRARREREKVNMLLSFVQSWYASLTPFLSVVRRRPKSLNSLVLRSETSLESKKLRRMQTVRVSREMRTGKAEAI